MAWPLSPEASPGTMQWSHIGKPIFRLASCIATVSMMGELTASLAHEIKQPIATAVNNAEAGSQWLARDQPDLVEVREAATEMVKESRRVAEIMTRVRSLFKKEEITRKVLDLNEVRPPVGGGDKILDAFFTTKAHGTGLGLAISRSTAELHGGGLWATANSGQVATFFFTLPNEMAESA